MLAPRLEGAIPQAGGGRLAAWRGAVSYAGDLVVTDGLAADVAAVERVFCTYVALIGATWTGEKSMGRLAEREGDGGAGRREAWQRARTGSVTRLGWE